VAACALRAPGAIAVGHPDCRRDTGTGNDGRQASAAATLSSANGGTLLRRARGTLVSREIRQQEDEDDDDDDFRERWERAAREEKETAERSLRLSTSFVDQVNESLNRLREWRDALMAWLAMDKGGDVSTDATVIRMIAQAKSLWEDRIRDSSPKGDPIFLFRDGPITRAVRLGLPILLEVFWRGTRALVCSVVNAVCRAQDYNLPNQAVIERLNSLLEINPTFTLTEDFTANSDDVPAADQSGDRKVASDKNKIHIPVGFQVYATVNADSVARANISPATKSRFTVLFSSGYRPEELRGVFSRTVRSQLDRSKFDKDLGGQGVDKWAGHLFAVRDLLANVSGTIAKDVHRVFHIADFVLSHHNQSIKSLAKRFLLSFRYMLLGELRTHEVDNIMQQWVAVAHPPLGEDAEVYRKVFAKNVEEEASTDVAAGPSVPGTDDIERRMRELRQAVMEYKLSPEDIVAVEGGLIESKGTFVPAVAGYKFKRCDLVVIPDKPVDIAKRDAYLTDPERGLAKCPTLFNNLYRIWAGIAARRPVLLTGPPGTGKTAVVLAAARLLGAEVERINMSGSTTLDQLIGSVVPTVENGQRIFKQRDGKVVQAIKEKKWVLLDELNLCPPEVLDGLTPFLRDRSLHVFATMNPASIGGGRNKLPRSIRSLFTSCNVEALRDSEVHRIFTVQCNEMIAQGILTGEYIGAIFEIHKVCAPCAVCVSAYVCNAGCAFASRRSRTALERRSSAASVVLSRCSTCAATNAASERAVCGTQINVRLLLQLHAVLKENLADIKEYLAGDSSDTQLNMILALRKLVELVYARGFQDADDAKQVITIIKEKLQRPSGAKDDGKAAAADIDVGTSKVIRIGSIYCTKASQPVNPPVPALCYSRETTEQLELLAASMQSKVGHRRREPTRRVLLRALLCVHRG
jgi:hypothetical protein